MENPDLQIQPSEPHDPKLPLDNPWLKKKEQQDRYDAAYREGWRWGFWSILLPPLWMMNFIWAVLEYSRPDAEDKYRGRGRFKGIVSAFFVVIGLAVLAFIGVGIKTHLEIIEAQRIAEIQRVADNERIEQEERMARQEAERNSRKELEAAELKRRKELEEAELERQHRQKSEEDRIAREEQHKKESELRKAESERAIRDRDEALKKTKIQRIIEKALRDSEDRIAVVAEAKEKYSLANKRIEAAKKIREVSVSKLIAYKNRLTGAENRNETALERENRLRDVHGTKANCYQPNCGRNYS